MSLINEALKKAQQSRAATAGEAEADKPSGISATPEAGRYPLPSTYEPRAKPAQTFFKWLFAGMISAAAFGAAVAFLLIGILGRHNQDVPPADQASTPKPSAQEVDVYLGPIPEEKRTAGGAPNAKAATPEPDASQPPAEQPPAQEPQVAAMPTTAPPRPAPEPTTPAAPAPQAPAASAPPQPSPPAPESQTVVAEAPPAAQPTQPAAAADNPPPATQPGAKPPAAQVAAAAVSPQAPSVAAQQAPPPSVAPVSAPAKPSLPEEPREAFRDPIAEPVVARAKSAPPVEGGTATTPAAQPSAPNPAVVRIVNGMRVRGVRLAGDDSKVLLDASVFRERALVHRDPAIRLLTIENGKLTFTDDAGIIYTKFF